MSAVRLFFVVGSVLIVLFSRAWTGPVFAAMLAVALALGHGAGPKKILIALAWGLWIGGLIFAGKALFGGGTMEQGAMAGVRVVAAILLMLLLGVFFPEHRLFSTLYDLGFPRPFAEMGMMSVRYTFLLTEFGGRIREAQRARLGYASWKTMSRSLPALAGTLLISTFDHAREIGTAMRTRCYGGRIFYRNPIRLDRSDLPRFFAFGAALAALAVLGRPFRF